MRKFWCMLIVVLLCGIAMPVLAQNISTQSIPKLLGWQKLTGQTKHYSGVPDGIDGDRENSYLWSMEFHGGYLYAGTMRDIIGLVLLRDSPLSWPDSVPEVTDLRGRIYRMKLSTGRWELFYTSGEEEQPDRQATLLRGPDTGYRMMKEFTAKNGKPVLYVGGAAFGSGEARLLAIDSAHRKPVPVFTVDGSSIRAIAEHEGQLFWASEVGRQPRIWYADDPLKAYQLKREAVHFKDIAVPERWFPEGAEILDMVSWNNALYVFFFDHDFANGGFWCAKLLRDRKCWKWDVIVGDAEEGAEYPRGMGRPENGGATPFVFKNKMYVGTISNTMWGFLHEGEIPDFQSIPPTGTQLFRFDRYDNWERIVPPRRVSGVFEDAINGFANPLNLYLWRFTEANGKLYAGTFDARTALEAFGFLDGVDLPLWNPAGFDLFWSTDGNLWFPESLDGFDDGWNYGVRTLLTNPKTGDLYLGTANPFYGCQVWRKKAQ